MARKSKGHLKQDEAVGPHKVHTSKKFVMDDHQQRLVAVIKQHKKLKGEEYIRSEFYPRVPKIMATAMRGGTGEMYLAKALETQTPPKWFRNLSPSEYQVFVELNDYLEKVTKVEPCAVKEILDSLDIDLTMEEVEQAVQRCRDSGLGILKIDFCQILFELCNAYGYLQRMKHDRNLYRAQMIGQFTRRQVLFYSISSIATFPHFSKDPVFHCLKNTFRPHRLKYYMLAQRLKGLGINELFKKADDLKIIADYWRDKYSSAYNDKRQEPVEPSLVRQQRELKEMCQKGQEFEMLSFESREAGEKVQKIPMQKRMEKIAQKEYKEFAETVQKFPPADWNRHITELTLLPLPLIRLPPAQLSLMRRYHVSCSDLPDVLEKIDQGVRIYYDRLKNILRDENIRHWIETYADYYQNKCMTNDMALMLKNYSPFCKEGIFVENPWMKPSYWLTKTRVNRKLAFD